MKTTEELGIWSEIKELIYQKEAGLEITIKCLGTSIQKNIAAMVFYSEGREIEEEQVYLFTKSIQEILEKRREICVSVGISKPVQSKRKLSEAFANALGATYYHIYSREKKPVIEGDPNNRQVMAECKYPFDLEKELLEYIKCHKEEEASQCLHRFFQIMEENKIHPRIVKYWVNNLRISIIAMTERLGMLSPFLSEEPEGYVDIEVNRYDSIWDLEIEFNTYVNKCMEQMKNNTDEKHRELMETIQCYILEHISSDLSLSSVADHYHISAPYLSTIFKQQTGENFVKYVIKVKMDFASHLLLETKLAVNEVAENTGYTNLNSFSNAFKKFYGLSPSQYRFQNKKK